MTEQEAIDRANDYVLQKYCVQAQPMHAHRIQSTTHSYYWSIVYGPAVLFPKQIAAGATVDGGELMLDVDEESGEVSVEEGPW
jgi:hypothetical protein